MAQPTVTADQRKKLAESLTVAILAVYEGHAKQALKDLGRAEEELKIPTSVRRKVEAFARDRAAKVQEGINQYVQSAVDDLPDDVTQEEIDQAIADRRDEIAQYHDETLMPYLASWAEHQAIVDSYRRTGNADSVQWTWEQHTTFKDDCTEAMNASPASLDELLSITNGPPPVHIRCGCSLSPVS